MADIYDLPNQTHMERGLTGVFEYANTVSEGIFIPLVVFALWIITFMGSLAGLRINGSSAMIFASFLTAVIAVPLAVLGLLAAKWMYLIGLVLALGMFWRYMEG